MEKNKSIALQKQIRDNAEDLKSEFLDMKCWEEQMKKADKELRCSSNTDNQGQLLPPVRKKKSSSRPKLKTKENGNKSKRIKSYDYSAWDKFDVDKACEEAEKENESEDSGDEVLSKEELEKNHEEATKQKVMGNVFVQEQKWHEAMACYNEAIKIFPYDAVFYANRALCHLKMDNLYSAEADCTAAIQRDEFYVKAYHRRATARMALKQYKEAIQDLKHLLSMDTSNKEAKKMLATASKWLNNSKPVIITNNDIVEREILLEKDKTHIEIEKPAEIVTAESSKKVEKVNKNKMDSMGIVKSVEILPDWLPIVEKDVNVVEPIKKSPSQRSKTPLNKISVTLGDFTLLDTVISASPRPLSPPLSPSLSPSLVGNSNRIPISKPVEKIEECEIVKDPVENIKNIEEIEIPPIPKTSIQFLLTWRKYKLPKFRYKYLKQLPAEFIPKLFQNSMESVTFSEILSTLISQFVPNNDSVFNYLKYLSEIKRFSTLTMFMGRNEKEDLNELFDFCHKIEGQSDATIKEMRMKYEV